MGLINFRRIAPALLLDILLNKYINKKNTVLFKLTIRGNMVKTTKYYVLYMAIYTQKNSLIKGGYDFTIGRVVDVCG